MVETKTLPIKYPDFARRLQEAMAVGSLDIQGIVSFFKQRGVSITYEMVRRYTLGQAMPRLEKMKILAEAVGCAPEVLVYGPIPPVAREPHRRTAESDPSAQDVHHLGSESGNNELAGEQSRAGELKDGRASVSARPILAWDHASELGEEYVLIPRLEVKASAGNGRIAWHVDEKGQKQAFRKAWCARLGIKPEQAATIVAEGSSMEPRVRDGDSLVVDYRAIDLVSGKVYVLSFQGEVYVKRIFKRPDGGLTIRSDNPDKALYPDMELNQSDVAHVQIIALVVAVSGAI